MPTYNRREFVPHAIRYFLRQAYQAKELIIIDDGEHAVDDLVPRADNIRYVRLEKKITLGAKLNMACELAQGDIVAHWDDDDWYADRRLQYQADAMQDQSKEICGINNLLYYDFKNHRAFEYIYPKEQRVWLIGSSLCYRKRFWRSHRFADINVGMDGLFVWSTTADKITVLPDHSFAVHMIHDRNVSPKKTEGRWWHPYELDRIRETMGDDWQCYQNGNLYHNPPVLPSVIDRPPVIPAPKPFRNIYACLVHEEKECIADLVKNLHYHDPDSQIILYNGGMNAGLLQGQFPFEKYGAVVYPDPTPVKWGYLHNFALRCMEFAEANFAFDSITMVDSDQLALRSGYSSFLQKALLPDNKVGMFSSNSARVLPGNTHNHVAVKAYEEYDLWKPLLKSFTNGEDKFVHWTFWPSSVFLTDAVHDLTRLFKKNKLLADIMAQTKIWATEEVILPTIVKLLGYEIANNPCSYEFVRFKKKIIPFEIDVAKTKDNAFWAHPVERKYNDRIRNLIRSQAKGYERIEGIGLSGDSLCQDTTPVAHFYNRIKKIGGWLSDQEANLLISITLKACKQASSIQNIVEVGSYHGKSTVLFASVVKTYNLLAKVYAIDTHDGKLGAEDQGLQNFPPSFQTFKSNIASAGVSDVIEAILDRSYNVEWQKPVSLLFIDGLHDYNNVSKDFGHFDQWIAPGGYVAFHDYADYFPGVVKFVDELVSSGTCKKIGAVDSLIVLQKVAA